MQTSWPYEISEAPETVLEPPAKKLREDDTHIIEQLQDEMKKRKKDRNIAIIQSLTNDTFLERLARLSLLYIIV